MSLQLYFDVVVMLAYGTVTAKILNLSAVNQTRHLIVGVLA
jgi:hypothetical protein